MHLRFICLPLFISRHISDLAPKFITYLTPRPTEAVQFLQTQPRDSRQDHKRDDRPFFMAAWRLLNVPAQRGRPKDVRQLLQVLIDDRYVMEPNRALLAMLVKAHLAK